MKTDKEKWIDQVFESLKGNERAQASPDLLARIEDRIHQPKTKVVTMSQWRFAIAAAILLLLLNVVGLRQYLQTNPTDTPGLAIEETTVDALLSTYQLYE